MAPPQLRAAIYVRVSTIDQNCDNQLLELRRYVAARGWSAEEYDRSAGSAAARTAALHSITDSRRQAAAVRCARLLASRSARPQPEALDHTARGPAGARGRVRQLGRRHRRHDARREAPDAHPWRDRGVRAGTHPRARAGWPPAGSSARGEARSTSATNRCRRTERSGRTPSARSSATARRAALNASTVAGPKTRRIDALICWQNGATPSLNGVARNHLFSGTNRRRRRWW